MTLEEWPSAADLAAIDIFCGPDPTDPTGERAVWQLVSFLQAVAPFRLENATRNCRLTIVTRGAVRHVDDPRGSALWGAVRSIALELLAEDTGIDFRLVDLGAKSDPGKPWPFWTGSTCASANLRCGRDGSGPHG